MKGAKGVLINITGGLDMTLHEVDEAANRIREEVDPDANIIFGSTFDATMQGRMRVSVVATGIAAMAAQQPAPNYLSLDMNRPMQTGQPALSRPLAPPVGRVAMPAAAAAAPAVAAPAAAPPPAAADGAGRAVADGRRSRRRRRWRRRSRPPIAGDGAGAGRRSAAAAVEAGGAGRLEAPPAPAACSGRTACSAAGRAPHRPPHRPRRCAASGRWSTRTTGASAVPCQGRRCAPPSRSRDRSPPAGQRESLAESVPAHHRRLRHAQAGAVFACAAPVEFAPRVASENVVPLRPSRSPRPAPGADLDQPRRHGADQACAR